MRAGTLNLRCRIERKSIVQDTDYGTEQIIWVLLAVVWCNVQDVLPSRSEAVKQGLAMATNQTRVRMRYRTDVDSSMRLVISRPVQTTYQIVAGPAVIGNKELIEFMVEKYSS